MKFALCLALFAAGASTLTASETAYTALRVIGKQHGADSLNRVVEVRGRSGAPEPQVWKVTLNDPGARGGLREFDVQKSRVTGERTPVARPAGRPINFNQLNLDSEGAFTVANQEAQKIPVSFDRVDYTLQAASRGPVWRLDLYDGSNAAGSIEISADNGAVLRRDLGRRITSRDTRDDREYLREPPPPSDPRDIRRDDYYEDRRRDDYEEEDEPRREYRNFPEHVGKHFERRGLQIKRFIFGG